MTEVICRQLKLTPQELGTDFEALKAEEKLIGFAGMWITPAAFAVGKVRFLEALGQMQSEGPTVPGFPPESVATEAKLHWNGKPLDRIVAKLIADKEIEQTPTGIRSSDVVLQLSERQAALLARVIELLESEPVNTPTPFSIAQGMGLPRQAIDEIVRLGIMSKQLVQLDEAVLYTPAQIKNLKALVAEMTKGEPFAMTDLRDQLGTTRKYLVPILDYFDQIGFTLGNSSERKVIGKL